MSKNTNFILLTMLISLITLVSCSSVNKDRDKASPDYSDPSYWAALPTMPGKSNLVPVGSPPAIVNSEVDVFYIHPTTLKDWSQANQDLSDKKVNNWTDASVIARQASVFNQCCEIYAPRYRQAGFTAIKDPDYLRNGGKAYRLAYSDVLKAFDYYIKNKNKSRPFIIAGHSQGALMTYWLLKDRIDNSPLQKQLVTAYIIGIDLMQGDFGRTYQSLKLCTTPKQTGCVLAWNSVTKDLNIDQYETMVGKRYEYQYKTNKGRESVCINPITFDVNQPEAQASASKGAVPGEPGFGKLKALKSGSVAAKCHRGLLIVEADPTLELTPLPGGSMHYHDIGLFYGDISANIALRIEEFLMR